jgi:hypothetical protein
MEKLASWFCAYFYHIPTSPSARKVGTRAEVREKVSPSYSLWKAWIVCRSDCSPRVLPVIRALTFNLTSTQKMWKIITWKVCQISPLSPTYLLWLQRFLSEQIATFEDNVNNMSLLVGLSRFYPQIVYSSFLLLPIVWKCILPSLAEPSFIHSVHLNSSSRLPLFSGEEVLSLWRKRVTGVALFLITEIGLSWLFFVRTVFVA